MTREVKSARPTAVEVSADEVANLVYEEISVIADKIIREEIEKQIEEKISGKKISSSRRTRIFQKVNEDVRKQSPELLNKIAKDQLKSADDEETERRVSIEIEKEIAEKIKSVVEKSMEKAIADEIFERVKIERLSRTPTVEPQLGMIGVRHAQVLMVFLFLAISYVQRSDLSVAIVAMTARSKANANFGEFAWNESTIGLLLTGFYWGYFLMQVPGGILAEKYGPKLVMFLSMIICSTAALFIPAATILCGWFGLYVLKVVQGVTQAMFIPAVYVFVARWIPPNEKSRLFTPAFGGLQMGAVVGMPIAGFLCGSFTGWPAVFYFSAIIGFAWSIAWIFVAANSPAVHRSISREEQLYIEGSFGFGEITIKGARKTIPWKPIMTSVPFLALMVAHFGQNWGTLTLLTKMPAYINFALNVDITQNSLLNSLIYLVGWILIVIFGFLSNFIQEKGLCGLEFERKAWNSMAFYGGGVGFIVLGLSKTTSVSFAVTLLTIVLSTNSGAYNGFFSNHADLSPNYVGILIGLSNTLSNMASILAPMFVAVVVTNPSNIDQWSIVFYAAGAVLIVSNTIFVVCGSSKIQPWNTPSDLHLHLQEDDPTSVTFGSKRRHHPFLVSNIDLSDKNHSHCPKERRRNRSI